MSQLCNPSQEEQHLSIVNAIPLTIKLIGSELRWSVLRFLRSLEIKQMQKRLQKEYRKLGELSASRDGDADEVALCQKQIDFLEKEITFLKQELTSLRQDIITKRCRKWGLTPDTGSDDDTSKNAA